MILVTIELSRGFPRFHRLGVESRWNFSWSDLLLMLDFLTEFCLDLSFNLNSRVFPKINQWHEISTTFFHLYALETHLKPPITNWIFQTINFLHWILPLFLLFRLVTANFSSNAVRFRIFSWRSSAKVSFKTKNTKHEQQQHGFFTKSHIFFAIEPASAIFLSSFLFDRRWRCSWW